VTTERLALTVEEAAELLSISRSLAYRWVKAGTLPAIRVGNAVRSRAGRSRRGSRSGRRRDGRARVLDVGEIRRDKGTGGRPERRADGRYTAQWTDLAGRRRYVYGRTEKECERKRDDAIRLANAGVEPSVLTLAAYLERYLARRMNLDEESRERYERLLRLHVRKLRGRRRPRPPHRGQADRPADDRRRRGAVPRAVRAPRAEDDRAAAHVPAHGARPGGDPRQDRPQPRGRRRAPVDPPHDPRGARRRRRSGP
jgi:excisionase family DNA binding protein